MLILKLFCETTPCSVPHVWPLATTEPNHTWIVLGFLSYIKSMTQQTHYHKCQTCFFTFLKISINDDLSLSFIKVAINWTIRNWFSFANNGSIKSQTIMMFCSYDEFDFKIAIRITSAHSTWLVYITKTYH